LLSVATKLVHASPCRSESKITTGTFAPTASFTAGARPLSLSGASTMPETPCATKLWTTSICCLRSSSLSGPFHTISTPISFDALTAPAWTAFQNSCVVPLGTTAILRGLPPPPAPDFSPPQAATRVQAAASETKFLRVSIAIFPAEDVLGGFCSAG
jgi:hypothetical protein